MPKVLKVGGGGSGVYIGRPSPFGNPFIIGKNGTRAEVIKLYRMFAVAEIFFNSEFRAAVASLRGKNLVCYCAPLACHGDVLLELANKPQDVKELQEICAVEEQGELYDMKKDENIPLYIKNAKMCKTCKSERVLAVEANIGFFGLVATFSWECYDCIYKQSPEAAIWGREQEDLLIEGYRNRRGAKKQTKEEDDDV